MERRMLTENGREPSTERCARETAFAAHGDSAEEICPDEQQQKAQIQSMRDYIEWHYGEALLSELEEKINSGKIAPRFNRGNGHLKRLTAYPDSGRIERITFRRFPGDEICASIVMKMRVTRTYTHGGLDVVETLLQRYRADMWISMEDEILCN